jgi:hypothetical protein
MENRRSNDYLKAAAIHAGNGVSMRVCGKIFLSGPANNGKICMLSAEKT